MKFATKFAMKLNLLVIALASIHLRRCLSDSDLGYEALEQWVVQAGGEVGEKSTSTGCGKTRP